MVTMMNSFSKAHFQWLTLLLCVLYTKGKGVHRESCTILAEEADMIKENNNTQHALTPMCNQRNNVLWTTSSPAGVVGHHGTILTCCGDYVDPVIMT